MSLPLGVNVNTVLIAIHTKGHADNGNILIEIGFA